MDLLDRLLAHDVWTTRQLIQQSRGLSDAQLDQVFEIDSRTLRGCYLHLIENMEVWNDLLYERTPRPEAVLDAKPRTLDGLLERLTEAGRELAILARRIARENRWDDVFMDVLDEPPRAKTFGGTIGHVITHNMHHRAQAMLMLEQLGVKEHVEGDLLTWESTAQGWG
jgi:uncharacterized damage-inducible protein DinB